MHQTRSSLYHRHRFPLSFRMVENMLAYRRIIVTHKTIREWAEKFGRAYANNIRRRTPRPGEKWHLDECVISIKGEKHILWRAVDQDGFVLEVLVQRRRNTKAAKRFMRNCYPLRVAPHGSWLQTSSGLMVQPNGHQV